MTQTQTDATITAIVCFETRTSGFHAQTISDAPPGEQLTQSRWMLKELR